MPSLFDQFVLITHCGTSDFLFLLNSNPMRGWAEMSGLIVQLSSISIGSFSGVSDRMAGYGLQSPSDHFWIIWHDTAFLEGHNVDFDLLQEKSLLFIHRMSTSYVGIRKFEAEPVVGDDAKFNFEIKVDGRMLGSISSALHRSASRYFGFEMAGYWRIRLNTVYLGAYRTIILFSVIILFFVFTLSLTFIFSIFILFLSCSLSLTCSSSTSWYPSLLFSPRLSRITSPYCSPSSSWSRSLPCSCSLSLSYSLSLFCLPLSYCSPLLLYFLLLLSLLSLLLSLFL